VVPNANDHCLRFLAQLATEYAQTLTPAVQETVLMRIQASHKHLVDALTPQQAPPGEKKAK
jgi:hypothetical protein